GRGERRRGGLRGGAFGEILLRHAMKIGTQETLPELAAAAGRGSSRDALNQRCPCGGDAPEQEVVVSSSWRVHAGSSWSRRLRCRVREAHVVRVGAAAGRVGGVARDYTCRRHRTASGMPVTACGAAIMTVHTTSASQRVRKVSS